MPSKPLAIKGFGGKLYVFSRETTYRVNTDDMYIESKMDGIGILDQKGVVVTDYGMFFCDANGMYMHDGTAPKTISGTVAYNQDYPEGSIGYKQALKKAVSKGYNPRVTYDGHNKCVYFILRGFSNTLEDYNDKSSRAYAYSIETGRWDYLSTEVASQTLTGRDGEALLIDTYQIYALRTSNHIKRKWDWNSKEWDMGSLAVDKTYKTIKFAGSPTFNVMNNTDGDDVRVYLDGELLNMTLQNKNYSISKSIASATPVQNWGASAALKISEAIYGLKKALPGYGETNSDTTLSDAFVLDPTTMPEFVFGESANQDLPVKQGEISTLKYLSVGQYILMSVKNPENNLEYEEIVKIKRIEMVWNTDETINRIEVQCDRSQMGTSSYAFEQILLEDTNFNHSPIRYIGPSFKFPRGSKGKALQVKLQNQEGTVDSVSIVYRNRVLK